MIDTSMQSHSNEGILLINKPRGKTSFFLVGVLRKLTGIKKIGHTGTLDPFATGVMVMLVGKSYTKRAHQFQLDHKQYLATLKLGCYTDTYDCDGKITKVSNFEPSLSQIEAAIDLFQGTIDQIPPMYSAKKINGQRLYELARKGCATQAQF